jgi:1-acyl-sn-glycerol-3-phosphate acyltransferase
MSYSFARSIVDLIVRSTSHLTVEGYEKVPLDQSFVIASNHVGRLDAVLIYHFTNRRDIIMLVAEKYRRIPMARWFVKQLNAIWVDRFNADFSALREALNRLKKGGVLVLAPEGTRSPDGTLLQARPGVSYLAAKAGVPIFPVALIGSEDRLVYAQLKRFKRAHVTIRVGDPFDLPPVPSKDRDAVLELYTDEIMCRIAALLPAEQRGAYAEHPRLKELLAESAG